MAHSLALRAGFYIAPLDHFVAEVALNGHNIWTQEVML